jgi:hypothetical protein
MRTAAGREGASLPGQPDLSQALAWVCAAPGEGLARHNEKAPPKRGPQSIVLRCPVPPFGELRQMLLVDKIDPGLHVGMSALHQDGELAHQSSRAKPFKQDFLRRALAQGIRQCRQRFFERVGHGGSVARFAEVTAGPPTDGEEAGLPAAPNTRSERPRSRSAQPRPASPFQNELLRDWFLCRHSDERTQKKAPPKRG